MDNRLGAIPLSSDILLKANIGLWAFELDEGKPPRMYVDQAMLGLIGLEHQISPEETYHAWYDNIDSGSYGLVNDAVEKMMAGEHAEVQYPWHCPNGDIIVVRCGGVRNFAYTAGARIEGTHQDVTKVLHLDEKELEAMKRKEQELVKSNLRAEALAYVSDHNPDADRFTDYIGNKIIDIFSCDQVIFFDKKGNKTVFNTPGTDSVPETLCADCPFERCRGNERFGNDGAIVMDDCSKGYMGESVHPECPVKSSIIQQVYADDQLVGWLNVNYLKQHHTFTDDETEIMKTISAYFGVLLERINYKKAEEERAARELAEVSSRQDREIIEILASEYSSVYYIDLTTDGLTPYTMNEETETTFGSVFRSGITYSEAYKLYVDKLIYPEDKAMMLKAGSIENIRKELSNKKTFLTTYRSADNKYSEMKFVKVGGDYDRPVAVALGFAEKDEQLREEQESKRYSEIANALSQKYDSIYYVNTEDDSYVHFHSKDSYTSQLLQETGNNFFEECKRNIEVVALPEDRKVVLEFINKNNLLKALESGAASLPQYKLSYSGTSNYYAMRAVKPNPDEPHIIIAVADINDEVNAREKEQEIRNQNYEIIEILASEYSSVYYIDLTTDGLTPYTMNEDTETTFGSVFRSGITYSEAYRLYVDKLIYPEDKAMMLKAGSIENIRKELAYKKTFLTTYRSADNKYSEMKFVKVGGDYEKPTAVALGFAEKDELIRQSQAAEQERQMNFDIIEILASEYSSVYYIDLTTDGLNPYTMNEETETTFGSVFRSGITYSEAYRLYVDKLIYPEDKPMMLKAGSIGNIMKELRTKKTFLTTYRNTEGHYSEMKFVKVGNDEGAPTAVALGFADKDEELRAKQEEERVLQRNIDIIEILASEYSSVYYIDMTTDELDPYTMNEQTESQFGEIFRSGIKYSDAFKMYVDKLVYPQDKAKMLKAGSIYNILDELCNKKTFITQYRSSDGDYCEMKFVKVGDEENPQSVALGFSNKNDEIRAELARKEKQDRDNAVITGLSDDFGCVVYTNYTAFDEIHYRFDPLFEKHIEGWSKISNFKERLDALTNTIMHPEDRKLFWDATRPEVVREAIDRDGVYYVNFRTLIDGEETYYQAKFARDEIHPETNVIAGFHNVDAETKREMEALESARSANKAKSDFLFNMSHDIRTPMNAIMGFTDMAIKNAENRELVVDCLNKTRLSGELLLSLINNILDMSRIESGRIVLDENEADVYMSFDNIKATMQQLAQQKNINLTFSIGTVHDRYVYCDLSRCMRVFVNLITNAIKYTQYGGRVKVIGEQVGTVTEDGFGLYKYTVEDNGCGMSEEFQLRAFDEFTRENTATVSGVQGTGLGLSVCRTFVEAMNGTIECRSKQGEGTTFTVTLPFRIQKGKSSSFAQSGETVSNSDNEAKPLSGCRVLLVEDNELNLEIGEYILSEAGTEVETADDGTVAVDLLKEKGPDYYDYILMDIQMPIMNGYEATRRIREMYPESEIPIIAVSANAFSEDREASLQVGMNGHIAKPINVSELTSLMASLKKSN